jgi:hypothetical protein
VLEKHGPLVVAAVLDNRLRPGECTGVLRALMERQ